MRFVRRSLGGILVLGILSCWSVVARAEDGDASAKEEEEDKKIGLNLDLGFASAYLFRGWNVFQKDSQMNQNMLIAPGITWTVFGSDLSVGYIGAFQVSGDNISSNIDKGIGAEQDLFASYKATISDTTTVSLSLYFYFYPFADEEAAGTNVPAYLEPSFKINVALFVDLGLSLSHFVGLQDAVKDYRYLYINPTIGKSFELHKIVSLELCLGYGRKLFNDPERMKDNVHDVLFTIALPIQMTDTIYMTPRFGLAWTNVEPFYTDESRQKGYVPTPNGTQLAKGEMKYPDQVAVYGGVNLGANF
ncbi:MAG: hypothetical protein GY854_26385 [Deltaproteobacteria bacterium]|nr:hypothetical protein [Deltaproteobacteria bacterium]